MRDGHDHLLALDQVLVFEAVPGGRDFGQARGGIGRADFLKLAAHHGVELHAVGEDRKISLDRRSQALELVADLVAAQRGEAVEAQFEDRPHLQFGQAIGAASLIRARLDRFDQSDILRDVANRPFLGHQPRARLGRIGGGADHRHHLVEVGDRDYKTEQDMRPRARLGEFELGAPGNHFLAEGDKGLDEIAQAQRFGAAAADRQHIGGK